MLDFIKEQIKYMTNDKDVLVILKVGSVLYDKEPKDLDIFVIVSNYLMANRKHIKYGDTTIDLIVLDEETYLNKINLINTKQEHMVHNYQLSEYFTKDNMLYKKEGYVFKSFDIKNRDIMDKYLSIMKDYHNDFYERIQHKYLHFGGKQYVHHYIVQKITENGELELTEQDYINIGNLRQNSDKYNYLIDEIVEKYNE